MRNLVVCILGLIIFNSCGTGEGPAVTPLTKDQKIRNDIDSLKAVAETGDLIVRQGDDLFSFQIRNLNEKDRSYSHAGMILKKEGQLYVVHISPDSILQDRIHEERLDSFINPVRNARCALYRFDLNTEERTKLAAKIEEYKEADVRFDKVYDLATDDKMYCSEMIAKGINSVTNNRIVYRTTQPPKKMLNLLTAYFKKQGLTKETIANRAIVTIDNLYLNPHCSLVKEVVLKYYEGQN